jgi:AcrR family transcriptional regulator
MPTDSGSADRRIHRTRSTIFEAMVHLIHEKGFDPISVKDITTQANVNRSTFYAHYHDKFDLLDQLIQVKLDELASQLHPDQPAIASYQAQFDEPDPYFVALFQHIGRNDTFYRVMLNKLEPSIFRSKLLGVIRETQYQRIAKMKMEQKLSVPLDILLDYQSASLLSIVLSWLNTNSMYTPPYMALQVTRISMLGSYRTAGLS